MLKINGDRFNNPRSKGYKYDEEDDDDEEVDNNNKLKKFEPGICINLHDHLCNMVC